MAGDEYRALVRYSFSAKGELSVALGRGNASSIRRVSSVSACVDYSANVMSHHLHAFGQVWLFHLAIYGYDNLVVVPRRYVACARFDFDQLENHRRYPG
jgi:hypothetical protein